MVLDNNAHVRGAGCSAVVTLVQDAGPKIVPYLGLVVRNFVFAFDKHRHWNTVILYDAISALADAAGTSIRNPTYVNILIPPLLKLFSRLKNGDKDLVPLLKVGHFCLWSRARAH